MRIDCLPGSPLSEADLLKLTSTGLSRELADAALLRRINFSEACDLFPNDSQIKKLNRSGGILFPYVLWWENPEYCRSLFRLRLDAPPLKVGTNEPENKYLSPIGSRPYLYFVPGTTKDDLDNPSLPVVIVEGEKKALAVCSISRFREAAGESRLLPIAAPGVWSWKGVVGKTTDMNGHRVDEKGASPDFQFVAWKNRPVLIVYDSDVRTNPKVRAARTALAQCLHELGANPLLVQIPTSAEKVGIDDFIAAHGLEAAASLFRAAEPPIVKGFEQAATGIYVLERTARPIKGQSEGDGDMECTRRRICGPLRIAGSCRDSSQRGWGLVLQFEDGDNHEHQIILPRAAFPSPAGEAILRPLLDRGFDVSDAEDAGKQMRRYLMRVRSQTRIRLVKKVGWEREVFVLPDGPVGNSAEQLIYEPPEEDTENYLRTRGSHEDWLTAIGRPVADNTRLVFAISLSFAGPLLLPTRSESGGFHFVSGSSKGKTSTLMAAGSVLGGGGPIGFCRSWKMTETGIEAIAKGHNDLVLFLDELKLCDPKIAGDTALTLGNGQGKGRGNRSINEAKLSTWRTLFLSNGELSLASHIESAQQRHFGGQQVRFVEIPAIADPELGVFDKIPNGFRDADSFAKHLKSAALSLYGSPLRRYLRGLVGNPERIGADAQLLIQRFSDLVKPVGASSEIVRIAGRFGLVAAAGELATRLGCTGWKEGAAWDACRTCFFAFLEARGSLAPNDEERAIRQIRTTLETNLSRFLADDAPAGSIRDQLGFRKTTEVNGARVTAFLIQTETFKAILCKGFDFVMCREALHSRGLLIVNMETGYQFQARVSGFEGPKRFYAISERMIDGDGDAPVDLVIEHADTTGTPD